MTSDELKVFNFKGPMGKGLDVKKTGVHIAYSGGTGVLPYLDLVAYLIRLNLLSSTGNTPHEITMRNFLNLDSFKFVLYVSYPTQ